jgi:tRNA 2-thiouridine synthesizing protein D
MLFTVIVRHDHLTNVNGSLALVQALINEQHSIKTIFFLFNGAYTANAFIDMPSDEPNISQLWSELAQAHQIRLVVCSASAARRGICVTNLAPGFNLGSIGELVESCDASDRVVSL